MKRILILLASTFPLLVAWRLLKPLMPDGKVDWFLFYEHEQTAQWYVYFTSVYLNFILFAHVIYELCKNQYPQLKALCISLLALSYTRLAFYWFFRGSIAFDVLVGCFVIFSMLMYFKWQKS